MIRKTLKIAAWSLGSIIALVATFLIFITFWLTPDKLAKLVSNYADQYVEAQISTSSIDYKLWSSFPYFEISIENALVVSKSLRSLSPHQRASIPENADTLARFKSFHGSINPWMLILNRIDLQKINLDGLELNLVAFSDSISNYNIAKTSEEKTPFSMPRFTAKEITLTNLKPITYYSAATQAHAILALSDASIIRSKKKHDIYSLLLAGSLSFDVRKESILSGFPFRFFGNLIFHFNPFGMKLDKYNMQLANLKSKINLSMDIGDESKLTQLEYSVSPFSLLKLLEYLPASWLPGLESVKSDIALEASVTMTEPYIFSDELLPSFKLNFKVPDSWLQYTLAGVGTYHLHNINLDATLNFNGHNIDASKLNLNSLSMNGEGIALDITAQASDLFGDPLITTNIQGSADFARVIKYITPLNGINISGTMNCDLSASFRTNDIIAQRLSKINAKGSATLQKLTYSNPTEGINIFNRTAKLTFGSDVVSLGSQKVQQGMLAFTALLDTLSLSTPDAKATIASLDFRGGMTRRALSLPSATSHEILPFGIKATAQRINIISPADSLKANAKNINISGSLTSYEGNSSSPLLKASLKAGNIAYRDPMTFGRIRNAESSLNIHLNPRSASRSKASRYQLRYDSLAKALPLLSHDSIAILAREAGKSSIRDNAETLSVDLDRSIRRLIRQWDISGTLKSTSGVFASYLYPVKTHIRNLDMAFSLDSIALRSLNIRSQSNALSMKGSISNLRKFMLGSKRTPVKLRLDVDADTISINQIAGTYEAGQRVQAELLTSGLLPPDNEDQLIANANSANAAADSASPTILIPRNIDAEINLRAANANYTNLHIFDIGTKLLIKESALNIDSLYARTDFGSAYLNLLYSTRDINNMLMSLDVGFDRIDVVIFFQRFQALLAMMPDMSNLSGFVSAKMAGSLRFFPNMDIDFPSVRAVVDVRGTQLKVHQSEFIRHLARMLLIRQKSDLEIKNMVVQASIHDNLLELYPFIFEMPKYRLGLMGENDFNGNMYYHISVLKSPIPFKFGINIKGNFDNYKIRFGGAKYKSEQASQIVHLVDERRVNLVKEMKGFIHKFVHKAALSDVGSPHINLLHHSGSISTLQERENEIENDAEQNIEQTESLFPSTPIRILLQHKEALEKALEKPKK